MHRWALMLWALGAAVGSIAAALVARRNTGFLLRDDFGVGAFNLIARLGRKSRESRVDA